MTEISYSCYTVRVQAYTLWVEEEIEMSLGDAINRSRMEKRVGLRALARELRIAPSYLSDIENGRRVPSEAILRRLSDRLDLDFDILMRQAGRLGEEAEEYIRHNELAGQLFRRIAGSQLDQEDLKRLLARLDQLEEQEEEDEGVS